ncbi:hypothetical protein [Psychromonas arctica]|uniref:hypothetical protein n=1 Tax=Psychromonas arctica TaxID=168275 RepID=UPI0003F4EB11|nr:hypothetical protein [Psychromonas arctica]
MDNKKAFKALTDKIKELQRNQYRQQQAPQQYQQNKYQHLKPSLSFTNDFNTADLSSAYIPYKSVACKKCPALSNGLCKCALKQMHKVA